MRRPTPAIATLYGGGYVAGRMARFDGGRQGFRVWLLGLLVTIAAAGDVHASEATRDRVLRAFDRIADEADVVLLAGDLTTTGEPEQAQVIADACAELPVPALAVLGNHDWHAGRHDEITAVLEAAGVHVLQQDATTVEVRGVQVGIVGTKGFVGGFNPRRFG